MINVSYQITNEAKKYLTLVWIIFVTAAFVSVGLLVNGLWLLDSLNALEIAHQLIDGMMRMSAAAALMTVAIDLYSRSVKPIN